MISRTLSADSQSIILLCSHLGLPRQARSGPIPLSVGEWNELAGRLKASQWKRPRLLLGRTAEELRAELAIDATLAERLHTLLRRSGQVSIELEQLVDRGIWALTRVDANYPERLKRRLGPQRPPVLFGAGPLELLSTPGIAMVGSRDLDPGGEAFARAFAGRCAEAAVAVISGGARGADRVSMLGALEAGGLAIGVLADSLEQTLRDHDAAHFIREGRLVLITPYHPAAGFSVGNAMGRNKLLYCLADVALVISSAEGKGGTWAGAIENARHMWVPLFVRDEAGAPAGNRALVSRGGLPLSPVDLPTRETLIPDLLARAGGAEGRRGPAVAEDDVEQTSAASLQMRPAESTNGAEPDPDPSDLFSLVWPRIEPFLAEPRTEQDVAAAFGLELAQAKAWLARAAAESRAHSLPKRPRRYQRLAARLL